MSWPGGSTAGLPSAAFGINERTKVIEPIRGNYSRRNQFPQSGLYLSFKLAGSANDVREERRSALTEKIQNVPCAVAQAARFGVIHHWIVRRHPICFVAHKK